MPLPLNATVSELSDCLSLVARDRDKKFPVHHPYELTILEARKRQFLGSIAEDLNAGRYAPEDSPIVDAPKTKGALRPIHILSLRDQVVYAYLGRRCLIQIRDELGPNHYKIDFCHRIRKPINYRDWFYGYFKPWQYFGQASLQIMKNAADIMVETDVSAYYENVDLGVLSSDLLRIGCEEPVVDTLMECLNQWSILERGLPQGYPASDLFAKFYLSLIDAQIRNHGFEHRRYADDIRLFASSRTAAKRALKELIVQLRSRSLHIQTSKTNFFNKRKAAKIIEGVTPIIQEIKQEFEQRARRSFPTAMYNVRYMSVADIIREATELDDIPLVTILRAYDRFLTHEFDKTEFHFLLGCLGRARYAYAVDDCIARLGDQPEETFEIVSYLHSVHLSDVQQQRILDFLQSGENIYDYQTYEILRYFATTEVSDPGSLVKVSRQYSLSSSPGYVRSWARRILDKFGDMADVEDMLSEYASAHSDLEKAEIICATSRLQERRRSSFHRRLVGRSILIDAAIDYTRWRQNQNRAR